MRGKSHIEWTESTWNPVTGCTKVSAGCKHCYAETFAERFRGVPNHPFEQGNKQTALAAANVFLEFNGYSLVAPDVEPLAQLVDGAISGAIPEDKFLRAMRASAIPTEQWRAYQDERAMLAAS